ncbi:MAG TPA: thioredoxin-like domain-containing protein [Pseudomonadales bacterium]|nr:thioredoxin-like domain-containing protein [Pseudomonadales bacterium]
MTEMLVASVVILWVVVLVLVVAVLALARQIGVLHTRVAPAGALLPGSGPKVGEIAPQLAIEDIDGRPYAVGGVRDRALLVLFVSPTCPVCKSLVPTAKAMARSERKRLELAFASDGGDPQRHRDYVRDMGMADHPYLLSLELGMKFEVGKLPFAVLIGADGVLRSKGLVNSREHLESLVESMDTGFESIQEYMFGPDGPDADEAPAVQQVDPSDLREKQAS